MRALACVLTVICALGGCSKSEQEQLTPGEKRLRNARLRKFKRARALELAKQRRMLRSLMDATVGKQKVVRLPADADAGAASTGDATAPSEWLGDGPPAEPYDGKPDALRPALVSFRRWDKLPFKRRQAMAPVINASTSFTLDVVGRLARHRENLSVASWSLWSALTVLSAGATGATERELRRLLHLSVYDDVLRKRWKALDKQLLSGLRRAGFKLRSAAGLWMSKQVKLRPASRKGLVGVGHATVRRVDIKGDPEKARVAMNRWTSKKAGKDADELVGRGVLHVGVKMLLSSAVTLSSSLASPLGKLFARNSTFTGTFYLPDCKMVQVPMMNSRSLDFMVSRSKDVELVDIPLRGSDLSMTLIMPQRSGRLQDLQEKLTSAKLRWWFGTLRDARGKITMPRFALGRLLDLAATFKELGVETSFGKSATFGALADPGRLPLETVLHRTPLRLKESGAAIPKAKKPVRQGYHRRQLWRPPHRRGPHYQPKPRVHHNVFVDRPFVLLVRHRATGVILYLARVYNPRPSGRTVADVTCKKVRPSLRLRRRRRGRNPYYNRFRQAWQKHYIRSATVLGALDGNDVRKVLTKHSAKLVRCVQVGLHAKPPLKGRIRVGFTIRTNGTVSEVRLDYKRKKHAATGACLRKAVLRMKFAADPGEPTVVGFTVGTYLRRR